MQRHQVKRLSIPMEDFGIGRNILDGLEDQPKRTRKVLFNRAKKFLLFAGAISSKMVVHSIATGVDAAGNVTVEVTYDEKAG